METIDIEDKKFEVAGHADDGLPIIRATAVSTQDGFDDDGNPKISVTISVPAVTIGITPGEVQ
jgi:hypothetical protein